MPPKNSVKTYVDHTYYHVYNRGVEKRQIFLDDKDYLAFLGCLKLYLSPPIQVDRHFTHTFHDDSSSTIYVPSRQPKNHKETIELVAYCLMPNHFHLLIRQENRDSMNHFMRSLTTRYSMNFNKKYARVGHLFQGIYKAVMVENENQFTWVSKYIHRNPLSLPLYKDDPCKLSDYPYSSYKNYLGKIRQTWVHPENILAYFSKNNSHGSYQSFVEESLSHQKENGYLTLES